MTCQQPIIKTKKMAFSISGFLSRVTRLGIPQLAWRAQEAQEIQVRGYAARKGTRMKRDRLKRALKLKKAAQMATEEAKKKRMGVIGKFVELPRSLDTLTEPPYSVYFMKNYNVPKLSLAEAIQFHREYHHPTMYNNPNAKLIILFELQMTMAKKTRTLDSWKSLLLFPHVFKSGVNKRILVLCNPDLVDEAAEQGADYVGGVQIIERIKEDDFKVSDVDKIICHINLVNELAVVRTKLKALAPKFSNGTLTDNVIESLRRHKYGIEYASKKSMKDPHFGWVECPIGTLNMDVNELEENFCCFLTDVMNRQPKNSEFITWASCTAPPSEEKFRIDFKPYLDKVKLKLVKPEKQKLEQTA